MNPSAAARNVEQILEKLFLKQIQENIEMINLLEKKIGLNVLICENFLKQFPDSSRLNHLFDKNENGNRILCAELCEELHTENSLIGVFRNHRLENLKFDACNDISSSVDDGKAAMRSELARLGRAKCLSDSLTLQLEAEEALLKAEIHVLTRCLDSKLTQTSLSVNKKTDEDLVIECDHLKERCLKSIKDLAYCDQLEISRVESDHRRQRQAAYFDAQERKIQEAQLTCSKLEIFRDIMALEENALLEMNHCVEKIYLALRKYLDVSTDIKSRFQNAGTSSDSEIDPCLVDDLLKEFLTCLLKDSQEDPDNPEMVSNEILLRKFEEKIASLDAKNSALLITMKEFGRVAHDVSHLLSKALHWLECSEGSQVRQHYEASESPCIYWNALAAFSGVIPHRLVERLLQVRKELDDASAALRKLELSFELSSEML